MPASHATDNMTTTARMLRLSETWRVYRRFWPQVEADRRALLADYATIVAAVLTNAMMIRLIDLPFNLLQREAFDQIPPVLGIFAAVVLLNQGMQYTGARLTQWIGLRAIGRLRNALVERLLALSFPVAGHIPKGDLLARLSNDVDQLKACIVDAPVYLGSHLLTVLLYVVMLFWIDTRLTLLSLLVIPVYILHQRFFSGRKRHMAQIFLEKNGALLAAEDEALTNLRSISSATAESWVTQRHASVFEDARHWAMRNRSLEFAFSITFSLLIYLTGAAIVLVGIKGVQSGRFGAGDLVSFLLYLGYLTVPARGFASVFFQLAGNAGAAERILRIFDSPPAVQERPQAQSLRVGTGTIELINVSFGYPGGRTIFRNLDFVIPGGETVALVGPSGAGKSTLANLLLRFYDVNGGSIRIDGLDLREVTLLSLRQSIAIVWQEPLLLSTSIRENLLMVRPEADASALQEACVASHAAEFIGGLAQGLDTCIGAGGLLLSAGQKQRLAIAQAFLRDAPILILDEATSALDSQSERIIVKALNSLRLGRTTLVIAHRYTSIQTADRVMYFNGDGTVTLGRHRELIVSHPGYRAAVEWQFRVSPLSDGLPV